jgi:hypothetical protein
MSRPRSIARRATLSASLLALMLAPAASAPAQSLGTVDIGCVPHARYDRLFTAGSALPHISQDWYVPQGLTTWAKHNWLIASFYYPRGDEGVPDIALEARISLIDRARDSVVKDLRLTGLTGHAGGIAVGKGALWVASEKAIYRYDLGDLERPGSDAAIRWTRKFDLAFDGAYLSFSGGDLWVGNFTETTSAKMYRYGIPASGSTLVEKTSITTPPRVQGVVVRPRFFVFSTSYGRGNSSRLITTTRKGAIRRVLYAPAMAEGATIADSDKLLVVYESGARTYRRPSSGGTEPCTPPTIRIQRTRVGNLAP